MSSSKNENMDVNDLLKIDEYKKLLEKKKNKVEKFKDTLSSIGSLDHDLKNIWGEIYENAIEDRNKAEILFSNLYQEIIHNPSAHGVYGLVLAKYLERMCKSNDQIIKLSELIENSKKESETVSPDDIFNSIKAGGNKIN